MRSQILIKTSSPLHLVIKLRAGWFLTFLIHLKSDFSRIFSLWCFHSEKRHFFVIFKFKIFTLIFNLQTCFIYQINPPDGYNIEIVFKITKIKNYRVSQEKCQNRFFELLTLSAHEFCPFFALRVNIIHFTTHMK